MTDQVTLISLAAFFLLATAAAKAGGMVSCATGCSCKPARATYEALILNCSSLGLSELPNFKGNNSAVHVEDRFTEVVLSNNEIVHVDLAFLGNFANLRRLDLSCNEIRSLANNPATSNRPFLNMTHLDLSRNHLHVLHAFVLASFPSLKLLNLSSNAIHTVAKDALNLPELAMLDMSNNKLEELSEHFFDSLPELANLDLSHNSLSRLDDGTFGGVTSHRLDSLDLSHNQLMRVELNVFVGMNVSHLDLSFNSLRAVPNVALRKLSAAQTIVLDGNLFSALTADSLSGIPVEYMSISRNQFLTSVDAGAIADMPKLRTLTMNNNPQLTYVHPAAITRCPRLMALDLSRNSLFALESGLADQMPSLRALYLSGNSFHCHCSLAWIRKISATSTAKVADIDSVRCEEEAFNHRVEVALKSLEPDSKNCPPFILPLFPDATSQLMGSNVSWVCKALGSFTDLSDIVTTWKLSKKRNGDKAVHVGNGECSNRVCVTDDVLTISYLHPEDAGHYECVVENAHGRDSRQIELQVKVEHIQIFPITVASTFVTLSWNTSSALSTKKGYILQVMLDDDEHAADDSSSSEQVLKQYEDIDVGLKMNSYTVNGLDPGTQYRFRLCLRKAQYVIAISSMSLTTKEMGFQSELGIETDYVSLFAVAIVLTVLTTACLCTSVARVLRFRRTVYRSKGFGMGVPDTLSQREIIMSPSDQSSSHHSVVVVASSTGRNNPHHHDQVTTCIPTAEDTRLVEHEVASPIDDDIVFRETLT